MLDAHAKPSAGKQSAAPKQHPTSDIWESMCLDNKLSEKGI